MTQTTTLEDPVIDRLDYLLERLAEAVARMISANKRMQERLAQTYPEPSIRTDGTNDDELCSEIGIHGGLMMYGKETKMRIGDGPVGIGTAIEFFDDNELRREL